MAVSKTTPVQAEKPRPTLKSLAEQAGVSAMTVSRALRDSPRVKAALRAKIHRLAARLGYRPDPEVSKLMAHLRRRDKGRHVASLAALTSIPEPALPPILRRTLNGARGEAERLGYRLELFHLAAPEKHARALERTLVNRGVEGLLLLQMEYPVSLEKTLDWAKFAVVTATPSVLEPHFPGVEANYFHNARLICARLAELGRARIGFVGTSTFCLRTHEAFTTAAAWQAIGAGKAPVRPLIFGAYAGLAEAFAIWFKRERPDAILAHAEAALPVLREALSGCGGDALLCCTSVDGARPPCAGVDEDHELIGRAAVEMLAGMLIRNERNTRTTRAGMRIDGTWVDSPAAAARA